MTKMEWAPGKYAMRGGGTAVVLGTIPGNTEEIYTILGYLVENDLNCHEMWRSDGSYHNGSANHRHDLMPPITHRWRNEWDHCAGSWFNSILKCRDCNEPALGEARLGWLHETTEGAEVTYEFVPLNDYKDIK